MGHFPQWDFIPHKSKKRDKQSIRRWLMSFANCAPPQSQFQFALALLLLLFVCSISIPIPIGIRQTDMLYRSGVAALCSYHSRIDMFLSKSSSRKFVKECKAGNDASRRLPTHFEERLRETGNDVPKASSPTLPFKPSFAILFKLIREHGVMSNYGQPCDVRLKFVHQFHLKFK